jgi:hypothetical protein
MTARIGIVGKPTEVYTLSYLTKCPTPVSICIFEREAIAGPVMPYREGLNEAVMLSNRRTCTRPEERIAVPEKGDIAGSMSWATVMPPTRTLLRTLPCKGSAIC